MSKIVIKSVNRKSDIIQAAHYLFRTKQYDKTTMQDVIDALGIAKGTIYHYFKSKEALLEAVIENIVETNIADLQKLIHNSTATALEKMKVLIEAGNISTENQDLLVILHARSNDIMHTRLLAATITKMAPLYANVIQQGCDEGVFATDMVLESAEFILAGIQFLSDVGIYPWNAQDLQRRIHAFPNLIEQQLKAPRGSFQFMITRSHNSFNR